MLSIVLSLLFQSFFSPQLGFLESEKSSSVKLRNIELDDETSTRAELYVCSQLGYIGCSLAGLISLLDLPHPVVDTSVNLIYFFM
jgi:hypothetical protein